MKVVITAQKFHIKLVLPNRLLTGNLALMIWNGINKNTRKLERKEEILLEDRNARKHNPQLLMEQFKGLTSSQKRYLLRQLRQITREHKHLVLVDVEAADGTMVKVIL